MKISNNYKKSCGQNHLKVIIGAGDLGTLRNVVKASWVSMMAGADFININRKGTYQCNTTSFFRND